MKYCAECFGLILHTNYCKQYSMMRKVLLITFCSLLTVMSAAQPQGGQRSGGFAAELDYPVVYEGPDVVFRQVDDHLWIGSGHVMASETLYIVEGDDRAVLIDTGTSIPGLDKIVGSITSKPYDVVLTHVHPDHAGSCGNFEEIWICKADEASLSAMAPDFDGKVNYLQEGQVLDLGGRTLEVLFTPGHTAGSVTFMDRNNHYGFSGDSFGNGNLLLGTDFSTMSSTCSKTLEWMQSNDIYYLFNGHFMGSNHETTKRIYDLMCICNDLLSGKAKGESGGRGMMGLDHVYARDGIRVNYGDKQMK